MTLNKRLFGRLLAGILLVGLSVAGTLAFVSQSSLYSEWFDKKPVAPALSTRPLFKPMEKFVITLEGDDGLHYLLLELSLVTHDPAQSAVYDALMPVLRNAVIQQFSKRKQEEVNADLHQLDALQSQLANTLRATIQNYGEPAALDEVLITKVVVQ